MTRIERIGDLLRAALNPEHLEVINESGQHAVPAGSETHVRVVVVAEAFDHLAPLGRHRLVQAALADELRNGLHALAIEARTPAQWATNLGTSTLVSPPCLGGSKHDPNGSPS